MTVTVDPPPPPVLQSRGTDHVAHDPPFRVETFPTVNDTHLYAGLKVVIPGTSFGETEGEVTGTSERDVQ